MIVKVYSTQMGEKEVETNATTWGELQTDLMTNGISYDNMKAVIGETKHTMEADSAVLPATNFTLFLMNKKTKAGADIDSYKYGELRSTIRYILHHDTTSDSHFNEGKNYTVKSTDDMRNLLKEYWGKIPGLSEVENFIRNFKKNPKVAIKKSKKETVKEIKVVEPVEEKAEAVAPEVKEEIQEQPMKGSDLDIDNNVLHQNEEDAPEKLKEIMDDIQLNAQKKEDDSEYPEMREAGEDLANALNNFSYTAFKTIRVEKEKLQANHLEEIKNLHAEIKSYADDAVTLEIKIHEFQQIIAGLEKENREIKEELKRKPNLGAIYNNIASEFDDVR